VVNPLAPLGRNENCWCGSRKKYKNCHGNHRPGSLPGTPLPPDTPGGLFISPTVRIADDAINIPEGGAPIALTDSNQPTSKAVEFTNWDEQLVKEAAAVQSPLSAADLGQLRADVMGRLSRLPADDSEPSADVMEGVFRLAAESLRTVNVLAQTTPKLSLLWNEELAPATFLGRTLLLADHVVVPDRVFQSLLTRRSNEALRKAAMSELTGKSLLQSGLVIPVPSGVAMAVRGAAAIELTERDLKNQPLVSWVRNQLILEGPTAREALFVRAIDDLNQHAEKFWFHGHADRDSLDEQNRTFATRLLQRYDPAFNYDPWIHQVSDSAIGHYVQRTAERVIAADVYGSDYVAASMFEARLLDHRGRRSGNTVAQAAMWADVPVLPDLSAPDLVKVLQNEDAVEDLRRLVGASLATARTPGAMTDALTEMAYELSASSHRLEKNASSDKAWQAAIPGGAGAASLFIGAYSGGLAPIAVGVLGLLGSVAPFLGARANAHREAAYLFVTARRAHRKSRR
jgi:hypothetical protein